MKVKWLQGTLNLCIYSVVKCPEVAKTFPPLSIPLMVCVSVTCKIVLLYSFRNDKKKHSSMSKTVSKHAQKVKDMQSKKKTKLRHT